MTGSPAQAQSGRSRWFWPIIYGLSFWLGSEFSRAIAYRIETNVTYWIPAGIAIAAYLLAETKQWPYLALTQFTANFIFDFSHGADFWSTLVYCNTNLLQNFLTCYVIRKWIGQTPRMNVLREYLGLNLAFIVGNLISISAQSMELLVQGNTAIFADTSLAGSVGNAMIVISLTPAILIWATPSDQNQRWWRDPLRCAEFILVLASIVAIAALVEQKYHDILGRGCLAFFVPVLWAGLRLGVRGATAASFFLCLTVVISAVHFQTELPQQVRQFTEYPSGIYGFLTICCIFGVVPAVAIAERDLLVQELAQTPTFWVNAAGRIRHVNNSVCTLLETAAPKLLATTIYDLGLPFTRESWDSHWKTAKRGKPLILEFPFRKKSGQEVILQANVSWFLFDGTEYNFFFLHDITDLRGLEEKLRQSQKMDVIGQFSGGVAHDFNNLLCVISGNLGMIRYSEKLLPGEVVESLTEIDQAVEKGSKLTRQLLAFGRKSVMDKKPIDLNETCAGSVRMLRRMVSETIEFTLITSPQPVYVNADQSMIEHVILNLCLNARDAMPNGGRLTLSISTGSPKATDGTAQAGRSYARLAVTDTGVGISPENMRRIFEPFFTTKDVGKGTGLGLASVHGIVQQHEGWVSVDSTLYEGSTFEIWLPTIEQAHSTTEVRERPVHDPRPRSQTILLVEDDPNVRLMINKLLVGLGYDVLVANDGRDARILWEANKAKVSLLLTDVVMPGGVSGLEIAEEFTTQKPSMKAILMSGYSTDLAGMDRARSSGIPLLSKPFELHQLTKLIEQQISSV